MNDLSVYARRVTALVDAVSDRFDTEPDFDRQYVLEALMSDLYELADDMRATASPCDIPECGDHTPATTRWPLNPSTTA
jgi:hypothetical protein